MIVHAAYDAELLGIDYERMLAVCFCCDCCCTVRKRLRSGPREFWDSCYVCPACASSGAGVQRLRRVSVTCATWPRSALRTVGPSSARRARAAGRCAAACPQEAIGLHLDDSVNVMECLFGPGRRANDHSRQQSDSGLKKDDSSLIHGGHDEHDDR